jgi:hypothetical protein
VGCWGKPQYPARDLLDCSESDGPRYRTRFPSVILIKPGSKVSLGLRHWAFCETDNNRGSGKYGDTGVTVGECVDNSQSKGSASDRVPTMYGSRLKFERAKAMKERTAILRLLTWAGATLIAPYWFNIGENNFAEGDRVSLQERRTFWCWASIGRQLLLVQFSLFHVKRPHASVHSIAGQSANLSEVYKHEVKCTVTMRTLAYWILNI